MSSQDDILISTKLASVCQKLSGLVDRAEVVEVICAAARSLTAADGACLVLREEELVHYAKEDTLAPLWQGQRFPIKNCISGWSILHRTPVVIEDIYRDERIPIEYYRETFVRSLAMMPIRTTDPLGAIGIYWSCQHRADAQEMALLSALADTASIALVNLQLYEELAARARELEQANRLKDEFLAIVSHELRTPMTAIIGWIVMLRSGLVKTDNFNHALAVIERNARHQTRLIEDLLDASHLITGKFKVEPVELDLAALVRSSMDTLYALSNEKKVKVLLILEAGELPVYADAMRLQQVIVNLVSNAIKFTPAGGTVEIELARAGSQAQITVRDTGKGIPAAFLPYVFEPFRQADGSSTRAQGGLGLGLSIAHSLVKLQGGTIEAHSDGEGRGATFTVKLPLIAARVAHAPVRLPALESTITALDGVRVLVVEDDPDAQQLIAAILDACHAEVKTVSCVREALELLEHSPLEVLLSDIGLPDENGYDLIRKIRAMNNERRHIPAAAITAYASSRDRELALSAGFQAHLAKPINPDELINLVVQLSNRTHMH